VGKDPDVRYFDRGSAIANFPIATSERGYTLANGTKVPERIEWHNIVVRRDQVSFVEKWVRKGSSVYVEGKLRTRNYEDQAGVKRYVTEIYADRVEFFTFGGRREDSHSAAQPSAQAPGASYVQAAAQPAPSTALPPDESDDLPF
jgi:single-strand DNA-binding protein